MAEIKFDAAIPALMGGFSVEWSYGELGGIMLVGADFETMTQDEKIAFWENNTGLKNEA